MADYIKSTNFAVKDTLTTGNPAKIVKGTEIDTEFNAIASAIASKLDANSPTLTGTPLAPTASTATNNTQIATTAYVVNRIANDTASTLALKANIASPTFTGIPAAPTAVSGTNTTQLATTAFVKTAVDLAMAALYPVGSIYINATNSTNPGTLLGFGTWVAFGAGRVPVGFNASDPLFDTAEETGGSKDAIVVSHTHTFSASATTSSNGDHTHTQTNGTGGLTTTGLVGTRSETGSFPYDQPTSTAGIHNHTVSVSGTTASTGSSETNANLQPYITVYMWKRTA